MWSNRDWLYAEETSHELFLSSIPFVSPFIAQSILVTVTLKDLMVLSLEEKSNMLPSVPQNILVEC